METQNAGSSSTASQEDLVAQVERALYQLYNDPDPTQKSTADRWLQDLINSPQAWNMSWLLLQHQSLEVQNFGALMLHGKITRSWLELPEDQYDQLRLELFRAVAKFSAGPKLVLNQLCRALVGVAFNTMPERWPNTVVTSIQTLRRATQDVQNSDFVAAILQLLTSFPEEYERTSTNVVASNRGVLRREISLGLQSVLQLLEEILKTAPADSTKIAAIKCCISWVQFGLPLAEISSLTELLFQSLLNPELLEVASESLTEMLSHEDSFKYPTALRNLLRHVLHIKGFIRTKLEENDKDTCVNLSKLVQETAKSNVNLLLSVSDESTQEDADDSVEITKLALEFACVSGTYPVDEECSEMAMQFWEYFLDCIASADPEQSRYLMEFYSDSIISLIQVFPDKAQYPNDKEWEEEWIDDERDDFTRYREELCDVAETLQRTMHVEYLQHLSDQLSALLSSSTTPPWQSVEAILFLLQGVASNVTQQSSPQLQNVLSLFPKMPPHPTLVKTALTLLGYLSSWFRHHVDLLQAVLPMILDALSQPSLAPSAALAFRDLCGECAEMLVPVAVQLIPACQASLSNLESRDSVRLVAAIGCVLSSMPVKDLVGPLETLVGSRVESIQSLALKEANESLKSDVLKELDILSALCHHIYPTLQDGEQHPVVLLLIQLFPSVQSLVSKWCVDHDVVESICVCINRAMRTVNEQYAPLLEGTVELLVKCYAAVYHAKLLDSAAQIVDIFGKQASCSQLILALLRQLHTSSLQVFQTAMCDHPDTVQAYLGLMKSALKTCPSLLLTMEGGTAENLFDIGLAALELPEQPTVNSASDFFVSYITLMSSVAPIRDVVTLKGRSLVQYILQAIAWAAPRSYLTAFTDIVAALRTHCVSMMSQWLEELLAQDGFPSSHLTIIEKQQFKTYVIREQGNKRVLNDKVREFALMCRGFHGTIYAVETAHQT